jgi:acyl-CoA dehydrogenase
VFRAPIKDQLFVLDDLLGAASLAKLPRYADYSPEMSESVLAAAGRLASEVLDPLNESGSREGSRLTSQGVCTPKGFPAAYRRFASEGWTGLSISKEIGGRGAPLVLGTAVEEIGCGANVAFTLCPLLARGAIEAIFIAGSRDLRDRFLPRMVSGEWPGTMNLTEAQAGSDLAAIRTRAVPDGDHFRLFGQKIFITYGDHDMAENIVHLVLARIDGAPAGVKGISMFIVPKRQVRGDGSLGELNDLRCASIEEKLGIHASPTCVMAFGDKDGAIGFLVGEPNRGLEYMFIMMNAARLGVGVQGVGLGERAFQIAVDWARTHVQMAAASGLDSAPVPLIEHPEVRRMLLSMKSSVESIRALTLYAAMQLDRAHGLVDQREATVALSRAELLIPIVKAWSTDQGYNVASTGVDVQGYSGHLGQSDGVQVLCDVRITAIYEGTNGIQANDLVGRKLARDGGAAMSALLDEIEVELRVTDTDDPALRHTKAAVLDAIGTLRNTTQLMLRQWAASVPAALAVAVPYLKLCGSALCGWLSARGAMRAAARLAAGDPDSDFYRAKLQSARFYADHVLPQVRDWAQICNEGAMSVVDAEAELI